jgi:hypothetical protein
VGSGSIERTLGRVICTMAVVWAPLVVASPWLASLPTLGGAHVSAAAYGFGALICHQRSDRSFHVAGAQLPVCARCTGLYLSASLGILFAWSRRRSLRAARLADWRSRLLWAALPTVATLAVEWWRPALTSDLVRALAAAPLGAAAGVLLAETAGFRGRLPGCERTQHNE